MYDKNYFHLSGYHRFIKEEKESSLNHLTFTRRVLTLPEFNLLSYLPYLRAILKVYRRKKWLILVVNFFQKILSLARI